MCVGNLTYLVFDKVK